MRFLAVAAVAAAFAAPTAGAATLLQVRAAAAPLLRAAGATRIAPSIWQTSSPALVRRLRAAGLVRIAEPVRPLISLQSPPYTDPFTDR